MPQVFYFLLKVILCSGILFGYYHLFLRNKVYHAYNRYFLLCAVLLSLTVPLLQFDVYNGKEETPVAPIQMLTVVNNSDAYLEEVITTSHTRNISTSEILALAYMLVSLVLLISFLLLLYRVARLIYGNEKSKIENVVLIRSNARGTPFSFFRYLFWNNEIDIQTETGKHIFSHELAHIKEKHSLDKVFLNIVLIFCWANPFFWLIRKELNMIHEFIADKKAVGEYDSAVLASMILQAAYPQQNFSIANHFFYSPIKRRLKMLSKYKTTRVSYFTRILVLPVMFILIAAFTFKAKNPLNKELDREYIVVIDAGHGGQDGGAKAIDGTKEKDINLALAKMVKQLNTDKNIKIILTRETDVFQTPKEKAEIANKLNADLFISIHVASTQEKFYDVTSGLEVYVARDSFQNSGSSKLIASAVIDAFEKNYKLKTNPNPLQRPVWVLQQSKCPAILIEAGYISHKNDRAFLNSKEGKETFAKNLLSALENYLGQPVSASKTSVPLAIANVLGLTKDQVNITNGEEDTIPKFAKDVLGLKEDVIILTENTEVIINERKELKKSLIIINEKLYDYKDLLDKTISGKRAKVYGKNNAKIIERYGKRATNGAIIFEEGIIRDAPSGKYDLVIDRANNNVFTDASQRMPTKGIDRSIPISQKPMYVVNDNVVSELEVRRYNPSDIESFDVLKGKEAIDKYGEKANNGVVILKVKAGAKQIEPELTLSGITSNRIHVDKLKEIVEVRTNLPGYTITSGTLYFVGAGFPNVVSVNINGESLKKVENYFQKIKSGTTITFDNVQVQDVDGSKKTIAGKAFTFFGTASDNL